MKRLLGLAALSVLALLILAPATLAQINFVEDPGDNIDPETGQIVGDDTPDCERPEDILESGLCRPPEPAPSEADGTITCEELVDQGQAQEAYNRGVNGDPAADPSILDEDGDGIACGDLPADTASNEPALETISEGTTGEETVTEGTVSGEGTGEEKTRRERRERTKGEGTGGSAGETTAQDGGTPGSGGSQGGSGGSDNGSGGGSDGSVNSSGSGASQGGLALAVNDGLGNISRGRLPSTGGGWAVLLIAGAVLIGGGWLLVRRFASSA